LCHVCIRRPAPVLRAYNAEADNLVRALKPYKLDSATERLNKIAGVISKLGKTMNIRISDSYHQIRIKELELTPTSWRSAPRKRSVNEPSESGYTRSEKCKKNSLVSEFAWRRSTSTT